jgi:hypothetical protein
VRYIPLSVRLKQRRDAPRIRKRQRPQQYSIHNTKNRYVCADANRRSDDGDDRKTRIAQKRAQTVAKILPKRFHAGPSQGQPSDIPFYCRVT